MKAVNQLRMPFEDSGSGAVFEESRRYRYSLWRAWGPGRRVLFIGLNPPTPTADAEHDDPTIKRCRQFTQTWGYDGFFMGNLFAKVSTDPHALLVFPDPVGPLNDQYLRSMSEASRLVVFAWGNFKAASIREKAVAGAFAGAMCLGRTKDGHPRHPLYLRADTKLEAWQPER